MHKILITGGQGYLARNLKPLFEQAGYEVLTPSRTELDMLNLDAVAAFIKQHAPNAIIHAATKGGKRTKQDTFDDVYIPNVQMFENLYQAIYDKPIDVILLGSGAEFDRRRFITDARECDVFNCWPVDPYGLSKNIITRRALSDFERMWVLRLFGCFNHDEEPTRFIRASIENLKRGEPIQVHQNRIMDFFYLDDVFLVIDHILKKGGPRNINLGYHHKYDLLNIASLIHKHTKRFESNITLKELGEGSDYFGNVETLYKLPIAPKLLGLEEGIRRTVAKLL